MNICLFGSARDSVPAVYFTETEALGLHMAQRGHNLVFGGGAHGMMGAAARGVRAGGGQLIGVAPDFFQLPGVLTDCDRLIITPDMSSRKAEMMAQADAFIIAPGGVGTLDEFFEALTLLSLDKHNKPIALYNISGFYDGLLSFLEKAAEEDFFLPGLLNLFAVTTTPEETIAYLETHR